MLNRTDFFIRERVGMLKLSGHYDILDPQTKQIIGEAREEISGWIKFLRFVLDKHMLPTQVVVYEGTADSGGKELFRIVRGFTISRSKVEVIDATGAKMGYFKSKVLSLGGAFRVFTPDGTEIALVKGDWKGWNFRFLAGETELGVVTKKWAGFGKELFTSADSYLVHLNGAPSAAINTLLLAAGLAIDTVFKENK